EIPYRSDVLGRGHGVGWDKVVVLNKVPRHFGRKEHNRSKHDQETCNTQDIMHGVERMEWDAVYRTPFFIFRAIFDFNTVGVVRADLVQRNQVRNDQSNQYQRDGNDVKGKETVERGVRNNVVTANPDGELGADKWNGREEVNNHLRTPVGHLTPGQEVTKECLGHQTEENGDAEDPYEFTWLAIRAVKKPSEHVQVHDHKEHRGTRRVHVADNPAAWYLAHDELDRCKGLLGIGFVVHHEENPGDDLDDQYQ